MHSAIRLASVALVGGVVALTVAAKAPAKSQPIPVNTRVSRQAAEAYKAEFLSSFAASEKKMTDLATAMPWEKFSWRPAQGVRSVCEVFLHMAGANYLFGEPLGMKAPTGLNLDKIEDCPASKEQVLSTMKTSYAALRTTVTNIPAGTSDANVSIFGMTMTKRAMLLMTAEHAGEHLGQSIAYARMNGVTPPWSR